MPLEVIGTDQTATYNVDNLDTVLLPRGIRIAAEGDGMFAVAAGNIAASVSIYVLGDILATSDGIDFFTNLAVTDSLLSSRVTIGATGSIYADVNGILAEDGINSQVTNHGTIVAREVGVFVQGTGVNILNTGQITSQQSSAILIGSDNTVELVRIVNSGQVSTMASGPSSAAIRFEPGTGALADVRNSGQIFGKVSLTDNADRYENIGSGVTAGLIEGVAGNDTLIGGDLADVIEGGNDADLLIGRAGDDQLAGGNGSDRILGGAGNDEMSGGSGNDTLNGQEGEDTIDGGLGSDVLLGQAGVDFLTGAAGNDTLDGGEGDDSIYGGADADVLRGRGGIDYIDGGLGRDVTEGGPGADLFIFNTTLDSTPDANRDVILDFEKGIDRINLVNVVPGVFVFRGTSAFTAAGGPELRLVETPDGSTIIHMDTDGNGSSDMQIRTAGVTGLTAGDFEL